MNDTGPARFASAEELHPGTARALWTFGLRLAEAKRLLGLRWSEWITGAPTLEASVALSAITQDEFGHARSLLVAFQDFPDAGIELRDNPPTVSLVETRSPFLKRPLDSWFDVIAANVVLDEAVSVCIAAARDSSFLPLGQRVGKILQEEQFHRVLGTSWLAHLRQQGAAAGERLQASVDRMTSAGNEWLDELSQEVDLDDLLSAGVLGKSSEEQRAQWQSRIRDLGRLRAAEGS